MTQLTPAIKTLGFLLQVPGPASEDIKSLQIELGGEDAGERVSARPSGVSTGRLCLPGGALRPEWPPSPAEMLRDNPRLGPKPLCPRLPACSPACDLPHKTLGKSPAVIPDSHWEQLGASGSPQHPLRPSPGLPPGLQAWHGSRAHGKLCQAAPAPGT